MRPLRPLLMQDPGAKTEMGIKLKSSSSVEKTMISYQGGVEYKYRPKYGLIRPLNHQFLKQNFDLNISKLVRYFLLDTCIKSN